MRTPHFLQRFVISTATGQQHARAVKRGIALCIICCVSAAVSAHAEEPLSATVVKGSSAYGFAQLFEVYQQHLGRPVTEQTAVAIGASLQQRYLDDGYSRPGYRIEDRGLQSGIVRIALIEAKITQVEVNGSTGPHRSELQQLFGALASGGPLRPADVTAALREARRLPGLSVDVSVEPDSSQPGAYRLSVDSAYKPAGGSIRLSNRGTEEIGRNLVLAQLVANGLVGRRAATGLFFSSAEDSSTYSGGGLFHSTAIGDDGATAQLQYALTSLQILSDGVVVDQDRQRWLAKYVQPFAASRNRELSVFGGIEGDDLEVTQDGFLSHQAHLLSLNSGMSANWRGGDRSGLLSAEVELGMNTDDDGQDGAPPENSFAIWRMQAAYSMRLGESWTWRTDGYVQYSSDELASVKQFKLGGGRIGRGFEAAAASGDCGAGMKLDLRRAIGGDLPWIGTAQLYGYYDLGAAWRNDQPERESAASAGFGVVAQNEHFSAYVEVAKPLTHPDADGQKDAGIFAELTYRF